MFHVILFYFVPPFRYDALLKSIETPEIAPEIGISNVDFRLYTMGLPQLCSVAADDRYDTLLKRIETFQRSIPMLRIDPIECY